MQRRGYAVASTPTLWGGDEVNEWDIATCVHCGSVIEIRPGVDVHRCTCCDDLICKNCVGKGCHPLEKKLQAWESRRHLDAALEG